MAKSIDISSLMNSEKMKRINEKVTLFKNGDFEGWLRLQLEDFLLLKNNPNNSEYESVLNMVIVTVKIYEKLDKKKEAIHFLEEIIRDYPKDIHVNEWSLYLEIITKSKIWKMFNKAEFERIKGEFDKEQEKNESYSYIDKLTEEDKEEEAEAIERSRRVTKLVVENKMSEAVALAKENFDKLFKSPDNENLHYYLSQAHMTANYISNYEGAEKGIDFLNKMIILFPDTTFVIHWKRLKTVLERSL
ncbi:MAG: hypothetical protein M9897_07650 [Brumimicrobium sp.]|nr:hypothetical protein [Brumimicrobium sp.]